MPAIFSKMVKRVFAENNIFHIVQVFDMILDPVEITLYWNVLTMNTEKRLNYF